MSTGTQSILYLPISVKDCIPHYQSEWKNRISLVEKLYSMTGGPTLHIVIECPQSNVGRVIGSSGATIKELQSRTGAKIQIDQNFPEGMRILQNIPISRTESKSHSYRKFIRCP